MNILLLEDEAMLRSSIKEFLEELECVVDDFYDGTDALRAFETKEYDALLLDINVPNLDGFGLLESVRKKDELKPVIFITAMTDIDDITKAYNLGCSDYVKKPFGLQELWLRLKNIVSIVKTKESATIKLSTSFYYEKTKRALLFNGSQFDLGKKHLDIIELLVSNLGFCVPLDNFRSIVWGREDIDDATIRTEINRLKKLLGEELIINIKGVGYKIDRA